MQSVTSEQLEKFSRKLGKMIGSGIPLVKTFKLLSDDASIASCNDIALAVAEKLTQGHRFSTILSMFPGVFTKAYVAMVAAAENQGRLDKGMLEIADFVADGTLEAGTGDNKIDESVLETNDLSTKAAEFVNSLLKEAMKDGSNGIIIRPESDHAVVCFSSFSELSNRHTIDKNFHDAVISRIKVMSALDIAEKRLPQDGRILVRIEQKTLEIKTQILPNVFGEQINMRFVSREDAVVDPVKVFPEDADRELISGFINNIKSGLVVFSGPSGSGKTTTLMTCTQMLNNGKNAIISIADVIDYTFKGITYIQNRPHIGLTMFQSMSAAIRSCPEVMVLDSIVDETIAAKAFSAAHNGVLVMTQMGARSATEVFRQFKNLNVSSYNLYGGIGGVVFQVLVRKLCPHCQCEEKYSAEQLKKMGFAVLKAGQYRESVGCQQCNMTGYIGMHPLYEFIIPDKKLKDALIGDDNEKIEAAVQKLGNNSIMTGLLKMTTENLTSPSEAARIKNTLDIES